jgi:ribosomal protein S18 acetylase RimI-like enzyme
MSDAVVVESLTSDAARAVVPELADVLIDAVASGASVGFLPPLAPLAAREYWQSVATAVAGGGRVLLAARDADARLVGTAQLDLATSVNGRHRAEVAKLMVHRAARRRGVGRALMLAIHEEARRRDRTTLILDTRHGDDSERLYRALGYQLAGLVPEYARSGDGTLHTTAFYYLLLGGAKAGA